MPLPSSTAAPRSGVRAVFVVTAALFALRLRWILLEPDLDSDSYGHLAIGHKLAVDPWNLTHHWVWLPLYHYLLAGFVRLHLPFVAVRIVASLCEAAVPLALFHAVQRATGDRTLARDAAIACALVACLDMLGVSAQQEALFGLLVLLCASAIDAGRMLGAGLLLAAACLIRYEAWGAAAAITAQAIVLRAAPRSLRTRLGVFGDPLPLAVCLPPLVAVGAWFLAHRLADGAWLGFLRDLYTFTHHQRVGYARSSLFEVVYFPILVPAAQLGPALLLVPLGARRALSRGWIVPLAIYAFLLTSYAGGGSLAATRYYGALLPFFCVAMAHGIRVCTERAPRIRPWMGRVVLWGSLGISTVVTFAMMRREADAGRDALRSMERDLDAQTR
jgi:uncharacterized membrane protein (UPF0136 family)